MGKPHFATAKQWATALLMAGMGLAGSASATLNVRLGGLIYDDVLEITWVQDANLCLTLGNCVNGTASGGMTWLDANTWAADLDYQGFSDWRLPYASVSAGAGPITTLPSGQPCTGLPAGEAACQNNEMAYMFYYNLDGTFGNSETGTQSGDGVTLNNIQPFYWSATNFNNFFMWEFVFDGGLQDANGLLTPDAAWAVRSGDVDVGVAVPEPATLALLGLGLAGLGFSHRKQ